MTERQWLRCDEPNALLVGLDGSSQRKQRLLACAFGRALGTAIPDQRFREVIECGERWADAGCEPDDRFPVEDAAISLHDEAWEANDYDTAIPTLEVLCCLMPDPLGAFIQRAPRGWGRVKEIGRDVLDRLRLGVSYRKRRPRPKHWCALARDIVGNPFRPVVLDSAWRTDTALSLARTMYESRDFGGLPILADALQDAGCDNDDILAHCRGRGPHVRGCWVVDLVLGNE